MVSLLPMYVGWVLATRTIMPAFDQWAGFWDRAAFHGQTLEDFLATAYVTMHLAWPLVLAAVAMGPLIWAATLLINDVYDLAGDRQNPRKSRSPLVQGLVSAGFARRAAYALAVLTLLAAWPVGPAFFALVAGNLALAWAYSVPPVRLKTRPGADVLVNAVGVGLLSAVAGWSIARPVADFPFVFMAQGLLVATAVYVPTTLVDHEADRAAGYLTLATQLGAKAAYRIGWYAWILANVGAVALSATNTIIPQRMLPILILFVPVLLYQYHSLIGQAATPAGRVRGIVVTSLTFLAVNLAFALMYTGLWTG
jgi:chlorophyll synthase